MPTGRFAPSPTGRLHLGNLRTALVAWLFARVDASPLRLRFDDLDQAQVRPEHYRTQLDDLGAIGLDWDGDPIRQSDRLDRYRRAVAQLVDSGLTYPCFCSRREIREAAQAPNSPHAGHHYPGTCRRLTEAERQARARASGREPALRLRTEGETIGFVDRLAGSVEYPVDDFVIQRNDGTPAYHVVTVVDDAELGIELVVRADDLLDSTSRQLLVGRLLDLPTAEHAHIPLVLGPDGRRLAKRHAGITLDDRAAAGEDPTRVLGLLASSLGLSAEGEKVTPARLIERFDPARLPTEPFVLGDGQNNHSDIV